MFKKAIGLVRQFVGDSARLGPGIAAITLARILGRQQIMVPLWGIGSIVVRPGDSDLETFREVFLSRSYDLASKPQGARLKQFYRKQLECGILPVIVDAGANVGAAALWFAQEFPASSIFALEPDKDSAQICRENCAKLRNIVVIEGAIGGRPGTVAVDHVGKSWTFRTRRIDNEAGIRVYTVVDILAMAGARAALLIVKVDIEGFEADLFATGTEWIVNTPAIFIEPHDWLFPGKQTSQAMQKTLLGGGFELLVREQNLMFVRESMDHVPALPH